jgi:ribonuclease-3
MTEEPIDTAVEGGPDESGDDTLTDLERPMLEPEPQRRLSEREAINRFIVTLGYEFKNDAILLEALTHRSYVNESDDPNVRDNERYEFLGDAVIDLVVSEELMRRHPEAREGALSRMRASIVSEAAFASLAISIHLGEALRLGRGEDLSGGRSKPSLIANAFEALVAGIYLDGGLENARDMLLLHLPFPEGGVPLRGDPKTEIQQIIQAKQHITPTYRVVEESGPDHSKVFVVEIIVGNDVLGRGSGRTKKDAEQSAAAAVLQELDKTDPR